MADPGQVIAERIVEYITAEERDYSFSFEAEAPDDPALALNLDGKGQKHRGIRVVVADVEETREKLDRQSVSVRPTVNVFVSKYMGEDDTRKALGDLTHELRKSLDFQSMGTYVYQDTSVVTKYDADKLRTQDRFFSVFSVAYLDVE